MWEVLKCDPRSIRSIRSIRSTDCSVISEGKACSGQLSGPSVTVGCWGCMWFVFVYNLFYNLFEDRKKSFLPRLHRPIFCVLKMSNYTAAYIIKALSQLLPKYESRTWDAKTRKLLSYQIVISGKIREVLNAIHDPYHPCDPYDPLTAASFPKAEGLFRTAFRTISHSWMLGMYVICFRLQFILQLFEDRKKSFLPRLHRPIFCVLKMSNYTAAYIIKALSHCCWISYLCRKRDQQPKTRWLN